MENKQEILTRVIPSDIIIYDILTRLPVESLVRFRCVCKNGSNLFFRDQLFVNLHSQRHKNSSSSSGLMELTDDCLVFTDHNDKKKRVIMPTIIGYDNTIAVESIQDSLNGLFILWCYSHQNFPPDLSRRRYDFNYTYYVHNPIINYLIMIPKPTEDVDSYDFRLCYDPKLDKYKVVVCGVFKKLWEIKILTLGHGLREERSDDDYTWKDIVVPVMERLVLDSTGRYFCLNGSLYWIIETDSAKPYIIGLDIVREFFFKIKLPEEISASTLESSNLNEMDGLLCLSHYFIHTRELKIWTLKKEDHEDGSEWLESYKVDMKNSMKIGPVTYKLELPSHSLIHPVFHVSQLKKHIGTQLIPSRTLLVVDLHGDIIMVPERVLQKRTVLIGSKLIRQVLIQWTNSSPGNATWEAVTNIRTRYPRFILEDKDAVQGEAMLHT
ncbi:putative F-box protein At1g47790 [Papaver somniferum]|uniref:putative F-box protein At1g47790 n=1 Tax=Papaver somniferum TaxID=3469 RepID=UPI000E6FAD50|nr:putative F-box protein At1g47790 [Papaver somniferum]